MKSRQNPVLAMQRFAAQKRTFLQSHKPTSKKSNPYLQADQNNDELNYLLTWKYLEATLDFEMAEDFDWRDYAEKAGAHSAKQGLDQLSRLACKGNPAAIHALVELTVATTQLLNELSRRAATLVRPVARQHFFWPVLKARVPRYGDDDKKLIKEIQLGQEAPFNADAVARIRTDNQSTKTAMALLCQLDKWRHKNPALEHVKRRPDGLAAWQKLALGLKPFTPNSVSEWFEAACKFLDNKHGGKIECDPVLRQLGMHRQNHSVQRGAQQRVSPRTRESNIRDGIKEALKAAFRRLANPPKKISKK